ncbi:MAG TPA: hypothetical protein VGF28_17080 [Thermoanaerobaculia bacterium]|jgi:hypothetical protein
MKQFAVAALLLLLGVAAHASDHADPLIFEIRESGITDLFFFPEGDNYVVILNIRPGLTANQPYDLEPLEFGLFIDHHSQVAYTEPQNLARYGGSVVNPSGIKPDVSIVFTLNNDASLKTKQITGIANPEQVQVFTGVRDDPFIFPRFFGKNVIATVWSIPKSAFPAGVQDFLIWGTSSEHGKQIDHVGRSNRTQNGRYDFINKIPPGEQLPALQKKFASRNKVYDFLNRELVTMPLASAFHLLFQLAPYDITAPDVMIFTTRRPPGFPNGRLLTDDVGALTCLYGDCVLQQLSYVEGKQFPRATVNDKPFLATFPYLAEPWPAQPAPPSKGIGCGTLALIVLAVIVALIVLWIVRRSRRRSGG